MAKMKPEKVEKFTDLNEEKAYEILNSLDNTYSVIYEPSIGTTKKYTPDFVVLSEKYGLIVIDVKFVDLEKIEKSDQRTIYKKSGIKIPNFNLIVKDYSYKIINQLVKDFAKEPTIVHQEGKNQGKLTFPHSSGIMLFVKNSEIYTKESVSKILSLEENMFIICNSLESTKNEIENFIINLNRPFTQGIKPHMQNNIIDKLYMESDANETDFTNKLSNYNLILKNFKSLPNSTIFNKSKQLKDNILTLTEFSQKSIEYANKNLPFGLENLIEELKLRRLELENEKFTIGVFGYYSNGKSTFLNALIGINNLPMAEDRLTATFTRLVHYKTKEEYTSGDVEVYYKNKFEILDMYNDCILELKAFLSESEHEKFFNKFEDVKQNKDDKNDLQEKLKSIKLKDYSGEKRDKLTNVKIILNTLINSNISFGNIEKMSLESLASNVTDSEKAIFISEVVIYLDNDLLENIEIVDTPGYGSTNSLDTIKTHDFVKKSNVVILLTKATSPLQDSEEKKFLEEYMSLYKNEDKVVNSNNLFIVANKIDSTSKSVEQVKKQIKDIINNTYEDELILSDKNIFTLSSKYHLDISLDKNPEKNQNIGENDLINFKNSFSRYLIEDKDKQLITQSFSSIENIIGKTKESFEKQMNDLNQDINMINSNIKKFQSNKKDIENKLNMYKDSINSLSNQLKTAATNQLDNQSVTISPNNTKQEAIKKIADYFKKYIEKCNKELSDDTAYEFYSGYLESINSEVFKKIESQYKILMTSKLEMINKELANYTSQLEIDYNISGLQQSFTVSVISSNEIKKVDLSKSFFRKLYEFIIKLIFDDRYETYAEPMVEGWNNNSKIYNTVKVNIDSAIDSVFAEVNNMLEKQIKELINNIDTKLNDGLKALEIKQKDKESFNKKTKKFEEVYNKIEEYKNEVKNQEKEIYGEVL
jgi:hypothetical protein